MSIYHHDMCFARHEGVLSGSSVAMVIEGQDAVGASPSSGTDTPQRGETAAGAAGAAGATGTSTPTQQNVGRQQRQAFLRQASLPALDARKPRLVQRWLHAAEGAKTWEPFGALDSRALETAWQSWQATKGDKKNENETAKEGTSAPPGTKHGKTSGDGSQHKDADSKDEVPSDSGSKADNNLDPPNPDESLPVWRVPVLVDHLFEVDLRNARMWSIFWKTKASEVMRGTYFFDAPTISPCTDAVATELEEIYEMIQPWLLSYADELKSSVALGADAEDKLKAPMKTLKNSYVIFLGPSLARIYTDDVSSRLTKTLWTAWSGVHGGGTLVARGYDVAQSLLRTRDASAPSTPRKRSTALSKSEKKVGHKSNLSIDSTKQIESDVVIQEEELPDTDSPPQREGEAKPPPSSNEASGNEEAVRVAEAAGESAGDAAFSQGVKSWVTSKMGNWGSAVAPTQQLSRKTQDDIKAAFQEAQSRAQDMVNERERKRIERDIARDKTMTESGIDQSTDEDEQLDRATIETEEEELERELEREKKPLDLIFVWHGIGQKIAEEWKSLDFTLAVTNLRNLVHKRSAHVPPADVGGGGMPELTKDRRIQLLPVMWRATLEDFEPSARDGDGSEEEHLDNNFTIDDIFSDTMPIIKQLISGVLFDIPLYLSHHREEIMNRVVRENNRMFRLFLQRNPKFIENGGRMNIIAHSLGAALASDILSKQPTQARKEIGDPGSELLFNVHNLYLVGSPVALFMWINKAQLIARRSREMRMDAAPDEALDRAGRWGCLAVDRIFNVFSASDPIGTRLNSTVDATLAKSLKSVALTRAVKSILRTMPGALPAPTTNAGSKLFGTWKAKASGSKSRPTSSGMLLGSTVGDEDVPDDAEGQFTNGAEKSEARTARTGSFARKWKYNKELSENKATDSGDEATIAKKSSESNSVYPSTVASDDQWDIVRGRSDQQIPSASSEKRGSSERLAAKEPATDANRGVRRMNALCEFGCVDFVIPSSASLLSNQYMDLLWSHASYWTEPTFADFVLATLSSSPEKLKMAGAKLKEEP